MKNNNIDFNIPFYIFEELATYIENDRPSRLWNNIEMLINLAKLNGKLTESQANYLIERYK